jgi:hypothetical protein
LGPIEDASSVGGKYFEGHHMPTMWGETNKIAEGLFGFTGKRSLLNRIEDRLVPVETEERTDINGNAKQNCKRNGPSKGFAGSAVQNKTDVLKAQKPARGRAT